MHKVKVVFVESPLVLLSLLTCCWTYIRALLYRQKITSLPLDLPLFTDWRMATELNMAATLTLVALIGVGAAVVALNREKEQAWYISLVTIILNALAWLYAMGQLNWSPLYES